VQVAGEQNDLQDSFKLEISMNKPIFTTNRFFICCRKATGKTKQKKE